MKRGPPCPLEELGVDSPRELARHLLTRLAELQSPAQATTGLVKPIVTTIQAPPAPPNSPRPISAEVLELSGEDEVSETDLIDEPPENDMEEAKPKWNKWLKMKV